MLEFILLGSSCLVLYGLTLAVYRILFHPLAKFPGPKWSAASYWYEFYYEIIQPGSWLWQIEKLHEKYGPIVRINPDEIHIIDPDYYDTIHGSSNVKRDKHAAFVILANAPTSSFATVSHEHHRLRRKGINHLFSKLAISKFEPAIQAKVDILASRFRKAIETKEIIRADVAYNALTMDTICQYGFAEDDAYLLEPDFKLAWKETLKGASRAGAFIRAFPGVLVLLNILSPSVIGFLAPRMALIVEWQVAAKERIKKILARDPAALKEQKEKGKATSLFEAMRDSDLPPEEKTLQRFVDESQTWIAAGTETVAKVLYTITTHLLADKSKADTLRKELKQAMATPQTHLPTAMLEQLPYLAAVISEGLRHANSITTRLPRLARKGEQQMIYKEWVIPYETPVSTSTYFILQNPTIFPSPEKFLPERWILPNGEFNKSLLKYLVNFGKGTRQCIGMNLAYSELYQTTSSIFRRFDMELVDTTIEDVKTVHDFFVSAPALDSKGVKIRVLEEFVE